jgi:hypothetical protein
MARDYLSGILRDVFTTVVGLITFLVWIAVTVYPVFQTVWRS